MNPYIRIIRPVNSVMASFSVMVVSLSIGKFDMTKIVLGMLVTFLTTSGGNVINDYYDYEIDRINHPDRPIPSGKMDRNVALYFSITLFTASLVSSFFLGMIPLLVNILAIFLLITYEAKTKNIGFTGNFQISFLILLLFLFTGTIYSDYYLPMILGIMAMLSNLAREITKDVEDIKGDVNRITLPKKIGIKNSLSISTLLIIIAVMISPAPYILGFYGIYYIFTVSLSDVIFLYSSYIQWKNSTYGQKYLKLAMIIALVSFLVGGLLK
ncbi:MAG: UbiA family prenyltransferase [Thermoplasmata archaeon]